MATRVDALRARLAQHDHRRPVLWGEPTAGNAWDDYELALGALHKDAAAQLYAIALMVRSGDTDAGDTERLDLLAAHEELFVHLRRGAHRDMARYAHPAVTPYSHIIGLPHQKELDLDSLTDLALLRARQYESEGKPENALWTLLDVLQLARDAMESLSPNMEKRGIWIAERVLDELAKVVNPRMSQAALSRLASALRRIDAQLRFRTDSFLAQVVDEADSLLLPSGNALVTQRKTPGIEAIRLGLLRYDRPGSCYRSHRDFARFGFSYRRVAADYIQTLTDVVEARMDGVDASWDERWSGRLDAWRPMWSRGNPVFPWGWFDDIKIEGNRRGVIAQIRATRMAVEYLLTGAATALPDPFGDHMRIESSLEWVVFTSRDPKVEPDDYSSWASRRSRRSPFREKSPIAIGPPWFRVVVHRAPAAPK